MPTTHEVSLAEELLESDSRYFESGAVLETLPGAAIARMPGLEALAAACVVHRVRPPDLSPPLGEWLERTEGRLAKVGCPRARLYLQADVPALVAALAERGYAPSREIGFLRRCPPEPVPLGDCRFDPVVTEADWDAKVQLHRACAVGPDGHTSRAEEWVELEYRKAAAGYMTPYLARLDGAVCGAVSVAESPHLARLKNIVVHPTFRRRGVGAQGVRHLLRVGQSRGKRAVGVFGIEGAPGALLYRSCGFHEVTAQTEWVRDLAL